MGMRIYFPIKIQDTGDEIILVKSKRTGKCFWWNKTKGMFCCFNTPLFKGLKEYAEEQMTNKEYE